jgi:hypothetical protein
VSDGNDKVGIYAMADKSGDTAAGVAVLVDDGNDVVIANVVGNVSIGKLIQAASKSKMVPKDLLKKLQNASGQDNAGPATPEKNEAILSTATNTPAEASAGATNTPAEK